MAAPVVAPAASSNPADRFRVGTLRYTTAGLIWLFLWLLWGDFCYTVMEYVNLKVVPLRLKELQAGDLVLPIILTTVPSIINFALNPVISTMSDRHRGPLGRRRPFLLLSAPLVGLALVLMAFSPELGGLLYRWLGAAGGWTEAGMAVFTVAVIFATFKIFDMFVNTTFWYFFNDVVPQAFMARFMGLFRVVASVAAMLFNYFIYEHSLTHLRWIYLGAAIIYFAGFSLMVMAVKEGTYPPPDPVARAGGSLPGRIRGAAGTYFRECLSHRVYWYFFLHGVFFAMAGAIGVYQTFLNLSLGITLKQLAMMDTVVQFVQLLLCYPAGALADRLHPIRVMLWMKVCLLIVVPLQFVWLFGQFTPQQAFKITIALTAIDLPISILYGAVGIPLMMRLLPRDRFGQFCSFNALCGATISILASVAAGLFMGGMRQLFPDDAWGKDFCYRLMPAWRLPCLCISVTFLILLYREWKRLGGEAYAPPGFPAESVPAEVPAEVPTAAV